MVETSLVNTWIASILSGDSLLVTALNGDKVFYGTIPKEVVLPAVEYRYMNAGRDIMTINGYRVWANLTYLVKVIHATETFTDIQVAADRIDTLLHRKSLEVSGGSIMCIRESVIEYMEIDAISGVQFRHLGGTFSFIAQGA